VTATVKKYSKNSSKVSIYKSIR